MPLRKLTMLLTLLLTTTSVTTGAVARWDGVPPAYCRSEAPAPAVAPQAPPSLAYPGTCRAKVSQLQRVAGVVPSPGYHHLGATTRDGWSGILGRIEVRDAAVPPESFDFVAARFMAKGPAADAATDGLAWLEVGWAETGWSGAGRQRIYTYDTNRQAWAFYDDYAIEPGDRLWFYLQTEQAGAGLTRWQAWLWWGAGWHLLTSQELPLTDRAQLEQYVEVHTEQPFPLPPVQVDNVQLKDGPSGELRFWQEGVPTAPGSPREPGASRYCVSWATHFDTWSAGDC